MPDSPHASPASDPPSALRARGLGRSFGALQAVQTLDLDVRHGEVLGLLGTNGAGKTTTLSMLAGVLEPTVGSIEVEGVDLLASPERARASIGYLPEEPPLYAELRVGEFLRYCAALHGIGGHRADKLIDEAAARCDLGAVMDRIIGNLSKGYRQRVGIAQAILHEPSVLILDEPSVGLDPIQLRHVRELIASLRGSHAVVLSSHMLSEVQAVCDRVIILHAGRATVVDGSGDPRLILSFAHPPPLTALAAIAGVDGVEQDGEHIVVVPDPASDPREALVARSVAEGWGLRSMSLHRHDLERSFARVVSGEPS